MLSRQYRIISCSFVEPQVERVMSSVNTTAVAIVAPGLLWGWLVSSYGETHDFLSVLLNESESDSHHTQLQWSRLFQKSVKAWHLHFQWRFQWHFWTLWSSYITAKRWKILKKKCKTKNFSFRFSIWAAPPYLIRIIRPFLLLLSWHHIGHYC